MHCQAYHMIAFWRSEEKELIQTADEALRVSGISSSVDKLLAREASMPGWERSGYAASSI
jgi:hypothetical protein